MSGHLCSTLKTNEQIKENFSEKIHDFRDIPDTFRDAG
jgi:hypothetical protein